MDSQRRFEGPDLQVLLAQVQRECGPDAQIIEANKLRTGGIGGFFMREGFEVIVAVDESTAAATTTTSGEAPTARRITTTPKVWDALDDGQVQQPARSHLEDAVMAAMTAADADDTNAAPATSILELAERRNQQEQHLQTPEPTVSTETPAFAEMLGRLAREALTNAPTANDDAPFVPFVAPSHNPAMPAQPAMPVATIPVAPDTTAVAATAIAPRVAAPAAPALPVQPVAPATPVATPTPAMPGVQSPIGAALACLGVPEQFLPTTHGTTNLRNDLVAALRWLPVADPIPTGNGSVIAVVGNADDAMAMAQQLASELGCDARDIVVAGEEAMAGTPAWLQLSDYEAATERRRSWRRRATPTVVAITAPLGYDPAAWARPMLDALEPTIAWGVVSADRKPEDVRAWADRLGGLDTLALVDCDLTVSPASMLRLGIPIARLDGKTADPITWANLLLARLAA